MYKKIPYILILSNMLLLGSEQDRVYTKDTCHRTYWDERLSTDEERKKCSECSFSRWEVHHKVTEEYIAHVAYDPNICCIQYLSVDEQYRKQGIGKELANRAIEDMRTNYDCEEISLTSAPSATEFWKKLGAKPRSEYGPTYVFRDSSSNNTNSWDNFIAK